MARALDHIAHDVRDLDAAADIYARLGFTVGQRNRHPWGTHNRIVQFPGAYIELLTVAEPEKIAAAGPRAFSFGQFNRDFLARHEGLAMLALKGERPDGDNAEFAAAGIGGFEVFDFAREGRKPDGSPTKLAFTLTFAVDPKSQDVGFFTCFHRHPDNFWNPEFQNHANTATGLAGVVLVAENPSDHHIFLSAFTGVRELQSTSAGITVKLPGGAIQIMDGAAFRQHFGIEPPDAVQGMRLAALRLSVRDKAAAAAVLRRSGIPVVAKMENLVVGPAFSAGATLVFPG